MATGHPVTPDEKARIVELAHQGLSVRAIGRDVGRAHGTVSDVLKAAGVKRDQSQTRAATEAKKVDNAARRAALSSKLLDKADELLAQMDQPFLVFNFGGRDNTYAEQTLDAPPTGDIRNLMQSVGIALQRHVDLERVDTDTQGLAAVDEWLAGIIGRSVDAATSQT